MIISSRKAQTKTTRWKDHTPTNACRDHSRLYLTCTSFETQTGKIMDKTLQIEFDGRIYKFILNREEIAGLLKELQDDTGFKR